MNENGMLMVIGGKGVHKIVAADQVEPLTWRGYVLIAVIYSDDLEQKCDSESKQVRDPNNYYSSQSRSCTT